MGAETKTCKHCGGDISERFVNVGGPIGSMAQGWLHANTGQAKCRDINSNELETDAEPAVES